ncbi:aminophospholipid-transporting P-type ATPase, partial [Caulochytrium protostelioides]
IDIVEHQWPMTKLLTEYQTHFVSRRPADSEGLAEIHVVAAREKWGRNANPPPAKRRWYAKYLSSLLNLFNVMLLDDTDVLWISIVLLVVAFANAAIETYQTIKISSLLRSYNEMISPVCHVIRNKTLMDVHHDDLVPGDLILFRPGERVPADCVLVACSNFNIDSSALTGETEPLRKMVIEKGAPETCPHMEASNLLFSGCNVLSGEAYGLVIRTGPRSMIGRIAKLSGRASTKTSRVPLNREIRRFGHTITLLALATAIVLFTIAMALRRSFRNSLQVALGILLAWVPQGLAVTVTLILSISAGRMIHKSILVKDLHGVETLGAITMLATDKTGTLTRNAMQVTHLWTNGILAWAGIGGPDQCPKGERYLRRDEPGLQNVLHCSVLCANIQVERSGENNSEVTYRGDATETGLMRFVASRLQNWDSLRKLYPSVFSISFSSTSKYQLSIHRKSHAQGGLTLYAKGAPEVIMGFCDKIMLDGREAPLTPAHLAAYQEMQNTMSANGSRLIAFAQRPLDSMRFPDNYAFSTDKNNIPTSGLCLLGIVALEDPLKDRVKESIGIMRSAGIRVVMITGDHPRTAEAVSRKCNILTGRTRAEVAEAQGVREADLNPGQYNAWIISGKDMLTMTPRDWLHVWLCEEVIFARINPLQKVEIVARAREAGHIVGVTGDGVNDAAALKEADLGIAMNRTGSQVSKDAADMIVLDDQFASIATGILEGRLIFHNLKKAIQYSLSHIMAEIIPYVCAILFGLPFSLTFLQILVVDLGFELFLTLSFAWDPVEDQAAMMTMPPRRPFNPDLLRPGRRRRCDQPRTGPERRCSGSVAGREQRRNQATAQPLHRIHGRVTNDAYAATLLAGTAHNALVDRELLYWAYLEAGMLEFCAAYLTFLVVFSKLGFNLSDLHRAAVGEYFRSSSPVFVTNHGLEISAAAQVSALCQAQSAYYLSILIMQIWNSFCCKARIRLPYGLFMFRNTKTIISIVGSALFAIGVVYIPFMNAVFRTSYQLNPLFLFIPFGFGAFLLCYATLR